MGRAFNMMSSHGGTHNYKLYISCKVKLYHTEETKLKIKKTKDLWSEQTKIKISMKIRNAHKNRNKKVESIRCGKISIAGKGRGTSQETKDKISYKNKGRKMTISMRNNMRKGNKKRTPEAEIQKQILIKKTRDSWSDEKREEFKRNQSNIRNNMTQKQIDEWGNNMSHSRLKYLANRTPERIEEERENQRRNSMGKLCYMDLVLNKKIRIRQADIDKNPNRYSKGWGPMDKTNKQLKII